MPGPAPKHPSVRQRRNRASTAATLRADHAIIAPELPQLAPDPETGQRPQWHELTLAWWRDIWASPMAPEYDDSDRHGLFALARLVDDFWKADTPTARRELAGEIRLQAQRFGLSPLDRRRLQWEIERTEEAQDRGRKRRESSRPTQAGGDPRGVLRAL